VERGLCNYEPYQEPLTYMCYDADRSFVENIILHLVLFQYNRDFLEFSATFPTRSWQNSWLRQTGLIACELLNRHFLLLSSFGYLLWFPKFSMTPDVNFGVW